MLIFPEAKFQYRRESSTEVCETANKLYLIFKMSESAITQTVE